MNKHHKHSFCCSLAHQVISTSITESLCQMSLHGARILPAGQGSKQLHLLSCVSLPVHALIISHGKPWLDSIITWPQAL
jgi:hypothetical protein